MTDVTHITLYPFPIHYSRLHTLFAVAVAPVNTSTAVSKEAPRPNSSVRVPAKTVFPKTFPRVPLSDTWHFAPVHAFHAGFGHVYESLVKASFPFALNTVGERRPVTARDEQQHADREEKPRARIHHKL